MKKALSILLSIVIILSVFTIIPVSMSAKEADLTGTGIVKSQAEAVSWLRQQEGASYDFGNFYDIYGQYWYGTQCVEFVRAYVNYLNTGNPWSDSWHRRTGNGGEIWENSLWGELGWTVLSNTPDLVPQPGDIFDAPGHTGVVISSTVSTAVIAESNSRNYSPYDGDPVWVHSINWGAFGANDAHSAHHFIRPNFYKPPVKPSAPSSVNLNSTALGKGDTLVVSWPNVSGASNYNVKLICTGNSAYNQTKSINGTSASFSLNNTGNYYVTVNASNSAGTSGETKSATATVFNDSTVEWVDYDGTVLLSQTVKYNGNATAPSANPVREGYTFQGWDKSPYNIKQDTVIQATYKINTYSVSFLDYNGDIIGGMQRIEYASAAIPPTDIPTKQGYVFIGWNSEEYLSVKKNLTVSAVYEWENTDLPSILSVSSAVRNEESTGYNVKVNLTNFPENFTKGKLIVALKTKDGKMVASETRSVSMPSSKEYIEDILVLYSGIVSTVEVSMVGVIDDDTTGTPKAKSVTSSVDIGNEWSDWSVNVPSGDGIITESRMEYRYKDSTTIKATTQPATPAGYVFVSSQKTGTYTNWSNWSGYSTAYQASSALKNVQTTTGYRFYAFVCPRCGQRDPYQGGCSNCGYNLSSSHWQETYYESIGGSFSSGSWDNTRGYVYINGVKWTYEKPGYGNGGGGTGQPTTTMYRYCTRSEYVNYHYIQSSFSDWQTEKVESTSAKQVETRMTYRFKTNSTEVPCYNYKRYKYTNLNSGKEIYTYSSVYPDSMDYPGEWEYFKSFAELNLQATVDDGIELYNGIGDKSWYKADLNDESDSIIYETSSSLEDTSGVRRHLAGTLENANNKVVNLLVYKGQNSDPTASQIEFAGQTVTDGSGNYRFDYITKEEPSVKTGDFVITIGVEGSTNYINIGTIDAPKPVCVVDFVDEDGKLISESNVVTGGTAEAPAAPEKEGYVFIGWDTALKNIQENIIVTAVYKEKTCVVVFVDWDDSFIMLKEVKYGSELNAEVIPEKVGQKFAAWVDSKDESVTKVTENMIVTAKYKDAVYTVTFLDTDGNVVSEQQVEYGKATIAPISVDAPSELQVFSGWDSHGEEEYVTRDLVVKPLFRYVDTTDAPHLTLTSGTYNDSQILGMYSLSANTDLYYYVADFSTDGLLDLEAVEFSEYTSPIKVSESAIVFAYAESKNKNRSDYAVVSLNIDNGMNEPILGDADGSGEVDLTDAAFIQRYCTGIDTGIDEATLMHGDVDDSGELELTDATFIQRYATGFVVPYPIGKTYE